MAIETDSQSVPWFGSRKFALRLLGEVRELTSQIEHMKGEFSRLGVLSVQQLEQQKAELQKDIAAIRDEAERERRNAEVAQHAANAKLETIQKSIVATEELAMLQEAGVYRYRHPLTDAVAYEKALNEINGEIKEMTRKDGGAILASQNWTVNGSISQGRTMVRDFSKLMLRAFNAEADNLVRALKPYKLEAAVERLNKVATTIEKLGKTMSIRVSTPYEQLRIRELELTADFLQKQAEEKEAERVERERLKEERKVQQEMERERARLEKERQHYLNAIAKLEAKGDQEGIERLQEQLTDVQRAIADVDYRAANVRAGYVYVISNIGSFGDRMVKVGMTRRLDPMDRIRELSDASVPFNFDIHALFFSKDAVGIESSMHERLASCRVNRVNTRREFFRASALEVRTHLAELAGELLEFNDVPEAIEYRQCLAQETDTSDEPAAV